LKLKMPLASSFAAALGPNSFSPEKRLPRRKGAPPPPPEKRPPRCWVLAEPPALTSYVRASATPSRLTGPLSDDADRKVSRKPAFSEDAARWTASSSSPSSTSSSSWAARCKGGSGAAAAVCWRCKGESKRFSAASAAERCRRRVASRLAPRWWSLASKLPP
jgi:hypothetical protein